jgi:signal peptidase I
MPEPINGRHVAPDGTESDIYKAGQAPEPQTPLESQPTYTEPQPVPANPLMSMELDGADGAGAEGAPVLKPKRRHRIIGWIPYIIIVVVVFALVFGLRWTGTIDTYLVPSGSMEDTVMTGDTIATEDITYWFRSPQPGDVIVFHDKLQNRDLLKRVIAVAGDTVDLDHATGQVLVNGKALDEPYTQGKRSDPLTPAPGINITYPHTVAPGCLWVMGDNRTDSADSRFFGDVPVSSVITKAWFVYMPLTHFHLI